jgi:membrane protein DedA with SNARE-associated domain
MNGILAFLLSYLLVYGYAVLFVVIFVSGLLLPLPVNSLLLAMGAFASQGYFNFYVSLAVALCANVLGDLTGFLLARRYGPVVLKKFNVKPSHNFRRIESYIRSYAGTTIFFTRFVGAFDTAANILAGLSEVATSKFLFYDILGNLTIILPLLLLGYFVGDDWQSLSGVVEIGGGIVLVAAAVVILFRIFNTHRFRRGPSQAPREPSA